MYVKLPAEDTLPGDEHRCGKLIMSMSGTRDAALNWAAEYTETLVQDGYARAARQFHAYSGAHSEAFL